MPNDRIEPGSLTRRGSAVTVLGGEAAGDMDPAGLGGKGAPGFGGTAPGFGVRFRDLAVKEDDEALESGIVGNSFLSNFRVSLDFARMVISLERRS